MTGEPLRYVRRNWTIEELRVLAAIYFNSSFSIGDDGRDECRAIADCLGRTAASIDRQWRNLDAVIKGKSSYNVGSLVKQAAADYVSTPQGSKELALRICRSRSWPLESLILDGSHALPTRAVDESEIGQVTSELVRLSHRMQFKVFSSGSQGFFVQGKAKLGDGTRFQAQITAVLIGSKDDLTIKMYTRRDELSYEIRPLLAQISAKSFKTGRVGFYASGKVRVDDERFQVAVQAVQIGDR